MVSQKFLQRIFFRLAGLGLGVSPSSPRARLKLGGVVTSLKLVRRSPARYSHGDSGRRNYHS